MNAESTVKRGEKFSRLLNGESKVKRVEKRSRLSDFGLPISIKESNKRRKKTIMTDSKRYSKCFCSYCYSHSGFVHRALIQKLKQFGRDLVMQFFDFLRFFLKKK